MAKLTEQIALLVGVQTAQGTINSTVNAASTVTSDYGVFIQDESLSFDVDRIADDRPVITGSVSARPGDFVRAEVSSFSFDVVLRGSGQALVPADGDHDLPAPIVALLAGAQIVDSSSDADSTNYAIGSGSYLTFKLWRGAHSYVVQDCRTELSVAFTPGQRAVMTVTVTPGALTHNASDTFPTSIDYGLQSSSVSPVLQGAAASIGGVTRGFLEGKLAISAGFERFPDSNASDGFAVEQSSRSITFEGNWYVDSSDLDQDYQNLILTSSYPDITFTLGSVDSDPSNSLAFTLKDCEIQQISHVEQAKVHVYGVKARATGTSGDDEFTMVSA